jgi:hypothetical protein
MNAYKYEHIIYTLYINRIIVYDNILYFERIKYYFHDLMCLNQKNANILLLNLYNQVNILGI